MLATVAYADIFDFPLTLAEVRRWLVKGDDLILNGVRRTGQFFHLPGRSAIIKIRRNREIASLAKRKLLRLPLLILRLIPSIKLVCLTGALAMNNASADDDIDLMVVTSRNRLWLTRLIVMVILWPLIRRGRHINNKICLNLWLDELALTIKPKSLYLAHEICQAQPVLNRDQTYQKFIEANAWYKRFLPNWKP